LLKHLAKGFRFSSQVTLVSNLKKAISELLKSEDEEEQMIGQQIMLIAPAFLFGITGNVAVEFEDFEEIAEHPMAAPAMATFEQLFEGLLEDAPDSFLEKKLDLSECEEPESLKANFSFVNEIVDLICDLDGPAFNSICIKASSNSIPVSTEINLHSGGLGQGVKLFLKSTLVKLMGVKSSYIFEKELDEVYHD